MLKIYAKTSKAITSIRKQRVMAKKPTKKINNSLLKPTQKYN